MVKFENVEESGIGDDAKWILYCISLLKDNKNELKKPDSDLFSLSLLQNWMKGIKRISKIA